MSELPAVAGGPSCQNRLRERDGISSENEPASDASSEGYDSHAPLLQAILTISGCVITDAGGHLMSRVSSLDADTAEAAVPSHV